MLMKPEDRRQIRLPSFCPEWIEDQKPAVTCALNSLCMVKQLHLGPDGILQQDLVRFFM